MVGKQHISSSWRQGVRNFFNGWIIAQTPKGYSQALHADTVENHVRDENISTYHLVSTGYQTRKYASELTPRGNHVEVENGSSGGPHDTSVLHRLDPQVESEHEQEDSDGFVIVGASD